MTPFSTSSASIAAVRASTSLIGRGWWPLTGRSLEVALPEIEMEPTCLRVVAPNVGHGEAHRVSLLDRVVTGVRPREATGQALDVAGHSSDVTRAPRVAGRRHPADDDAVANGEARGRVD